MPVSRIRWTPRGTTIVDLGTERQISHFSLYPFTDIQTAEEGIEITIHFPKGVGLSKKPLRIRKVKGKPPKEEELP